MGWSMYFDTYTFENCLYMCICIYMCVLVTAPPHDPPLGFLPLQMLLATFGPHITVYTSVFLYISDTCHCNSEVFISIRLGPEQTNGFR